MSTLIPLARRFYQKIDVLMFDGLKNSNIKNLDVDKDQI